MQPMTRQMFRVRGNQGVQLFSEDVPGCDDNHVLIETAFSMISPGTELHYVRQARETGEQLDLGYCAAGTVVEAGAHADHVGPGSRVVAMGWRCAIHSDHLLMPRRLVCPLPDSLALEQAILACLAATVIHAGDRSRLTGNDRVLVLGLGGVGLLMALRASDIGASVSVWDPQPDRLKELPWPACDPGAADPGTRFTKIFFCADGDVSTQMADILRLLAPDGNGQDRAMLVNLGRLSGLIGFSPASGNFDLVNISRCGAGYRDDAYHAGLREVTPLPGEATVDANLKRAVDLIDRQGSVVALLPRTVFSVTEALELYRGNNTFPKGFSLIRHRGN